MYFLHCQLVYWKPSLEVPWRAHFPRAACYAMNVDALQGPTLRPPTFPWRRQSVAARGTRFSGFPLAQARSGRASDGSSGPASSWAAGCISQGLWAGGGPSCRGTLGACWERFLPPRPKGPGTAAAAAMEPARGCRRQRAAAPTPHRQRYGSWRASHRGAAAPGQCHRFPPAGRAAPQVLQQLRQLPGFVFGQRLSPGGFVRHGPSASPHAGAILGGHRRRLCFSGSWAARQGSATVETDEAEESIPCICNKTVRLFICFFMETTFEKF